MSAAKSRAQTQLERPWQRTLVEALETFGYAVQHIYPLRTKNQGWRTSTTAKGWPDLVAIRGQWLIAIEVKGETTRIEDEQRAWLMRFAGLGSQHVRTWVLRPTDDWGQIAAWIASPGLAPRIFGWSPLPEGHAEYPGPA